MTLTTERNNLSDALVVAKSCRRYQTVFRHGVRYNRLTTCEPLERVVYYLEARMAYLGGSTLNQYRGVPCL
jgi:hypothetical protein